MLDQTGGIICYNFQEETDENCNISHKIGKSQLNKQWMLSNSRKAPHCMYYVTLPTIQPSASWKILNRSLDNDSVVSPVLTSWGVKRSGKLVLTVKKNVASWWLYNRVIHKFSISILVYCLVQLSPFVWFMVKVLDNTRSFCLLNKPWLSVLCTKVSMASAPGIK